MEVAAELVAKGEAELEEWFVTGLSAESIPVREMLAVVRHLAAGGHERQAKEWAELLQESLAERREQGGTLQVFALRLEWCEDPERVREDFARTIRRVFRDRKATAMAASVGLDEGVALVECIRRLTFLSQLKSGAFCHDNTWGFGVVARVDDFYRKLTVDFNQRRGHEMSFSYAAESLRLIDEGHLMAIRHREPERLAALVKDDPSEVVRIALRSFGPMPAVRLREVVVPDVVTEEQWKSFWDGARRGLKADPRVDLPARRNEAIRLLTGEESVADIRLERLRVSRDTAEIFSLIRELESEVGREGIDGEARVVVADRLAFAMKGEERRRPAMLARYLEMARRLGLDAELQNAVRIEQFFHAPTMLDAARGLPARDLNALLNQMAQVDTDRTADVLLTVLADLPEHAVFEVAALLPTTDRWARFVADCRAAVEARQVSEAVVYWLCTHLDQVASDGIATISDLLAQAVAVLETDHSGDRYQAQKLIRELFVRREWLKDALDRLDPAQRADLLARVGRSSGWEASDQRSVLAAMIKLYPELADVLASKPMAEAQQRRTGRYTSWRSYRAREEQLRKLIEEDVPANSREIAVARSYGDLSENHEYKAAKEHQGILLRRRGELERDLQEVKGTDFAEFPTGSIGMGTCVDLSLENDVTKRYLILGEWDGDASLGVLSSQSSLAELLAGRTAGEEVSLPGEQDGSTCRARIVSVLPLPDDIRAWVAGT